MTGFAAIPLDPLPIDEQPPPLPIAAEVSAVFAGPEVDGILCSRQHFNDPAARYCHACGISMVHQTHFPARGRRPPLGVLVLDDGSTFVLDGDYIVGRDPHTHISVQRGDTRPLAIPDDGLHTSRAHLRIELDSWSVVVTDLASANGTFLAAHGAADWTKLEPNVPTVLTPGAELHLGGRRIVFESHSRPALSGLPT